MIFLPDEETVNSLAMSSQGLKLGAQGEITAGPFGRTCEMGTNLSGQGVGTTISVAFTKGAFAGFSAEGAVLAPRPAMNNTFYGRQISPKEILNDENVILPSNKVTLLQDVYQKLELLSKGETVEAAANDEAEKAAAEVHAQPNADVVQVDAAAEAAKEASK